MVAFNGRYSLFRYGRKAHKMIMKLTKWGSLNPPLQCPPSMCSFMTTSKFSISLKSCWEQIL